MSTPRTTLSFEIVWTSIDYRLKRALDQIDHMTPTPPLDAIRAHLLAIYEHAALAGLYPSE